MGNMVSVLLLKHRSEVRYHNVLCVDCGGYLKPSHRVLDHVYGTTIIRSPIEITDSSNVKNITLVYYNITIRNFSIDISLKILCYS